MLRVRFVAFPCKRGFVFKQGPNAEGKDWRLKEKIPLSNLDLKDWNVGGLSRVCLQRQAVKPIYRNSCYRRKF